MSTDERNLVGQQPSDIVQELRESAEQGYAVSFSSLAARITDADLADEARKACSVAAVSARRFYDRLGIDHIELSDQIVATMRELNEQVGDDIFVLGPTLYNGRTSDGLTDAQAQEKQDRRILMESPR